MPRLLCALLVLVSLWSHIPGLSAARQGRVIHQPKAQYEPPEHKGEEHGEEGDRDIDGPEASLAPELDFLADFAGKKRLWVITAPSHSDNYLRMMEKQIQDMEPEGLNCRLAERDTFIITVIQNAMMEARIQKTTFQGEATVESMDPDMATKLLHYLELTDQTFSMLVIKKNLRVSESFPYPVRVEAVLEVIDQFPMRKLEKLTRKGLQNKCKITKKRLVAKKRGPIKKKVFAPQKQGDVTSALTVQRKPLDKAALKSKIQDILSGRSRFVIRKRPSNPKEANVLSTGKFNSKAVGGEDRKQTSQPMKGNGDVPTVKNGLKSNTYNSTLDGGERRVLKMLKEDKLEEESRGEESPEKNTSQKKGKGKKDSKKKKGKGRGKKSNREVNDKDKGVIKDFLETFKGKRRLLVVATPSSSTSQYIQQREENELHHCDLALRKVTMATILSSGNDATLTLQHYQLDSEPPFTSLPERFTDQQLISLLRKEYGMSSLEFSMTMTDYDLRPSRVFYSPPLSSAMMEYIDTFPSRQSEKERERKTTLPCSKAQQRSGAENSLLRFMSKRRLLIISTPTEDDYSFQQQLQALNGQACPMGIRHFALLKLIGAGPSALGSVELFPLNGRSQSENELLSEDVVNSLRDQLKMSRDYFSMVVVGKDGDVKAWFPSPMWSLANVYDLVDSMELRQREEKLQRTLGIFCPEDTGGSYHGYGEEAEDSYLYHRAED